MPCSGGTEGEIQFQSCKLSSTTGYVSNEDLKSFLGVQGSIGFNVGMLIAMFGEIQIVAFFALRFKKPAEQAF